MLLIEHNSERLNCLAQAHIVAKHAVQVEGPKSSHPVDSLHLVLSEIRIHFYFERVLLHDLVARKHFQKVQALSNLGLKTGRNPLGLPERGQIQRKDLDQLGKKMHDFLRGIAVDLLVQLDSLDRGQDEERQELEEAGRLLFLNLCV